ncbi:TonB-dependent siderophore receptor [Lampropedia hyalina DSM 16112]|jgi:iron complex outermembrane receptor protein|uniref:TonB-dependent siderophore receptor n=1 Tax=Lampropedia hyalina DSM 16112 TaxID=1122156 RepID=A0A1M5AK28_9BURK|nr:TonB-dependent receptor [Lampropedia hyalina]SHF30477.1 TonB-dependent siderophore receptor [Lampropedia hyalina DSM 16112]
MQVAFGMGSTVLKPPSNNSISVHGADYMGRDKTVMVRAEYDITPETMIYGAWGKRTDDHLATLGYPTVQPNGDFTLRATTARYAYDTQAGHAGLNTRLKTGTVGHQLAFSVNYFDEDYASAGAVGAPGTSNMYQPVPLPMPVAPGAAQKSTDTRLTSFALADTISFYDDRLQLTLGLRKQQVKTFNVASNALYNKSAVTPMAGLVFKLRGNVSIYGNYIEGLTQGPTAPENTGLDNAGEVFAPYKTKQQEVGVKVDWGNLTTTLSAYQIARPNPITENNIYSLDGEQRNRGIELNVFGELNRSLRLLAGATIIDTKVTKAVGDTLGKKPSGVPATQLKFGTEWDTPFVPGLTLTARASYSSSQYLDGTNTKKVPNWNRLDLGARYATQIAGKDVVFRANVNNALDKDYWAAVNSGYLVLGAPRTWTLSATVDF